MRYGGRPGSRSKKESAMEPKASATYPTEKSLQFLIRENNRPEVETYLEKASPAQAARELSGIDKETKALLFDMLGPAKSAEIITKVFNFEKGDILGGLSLSQASPIVGEMGTETQVRLIRDMKDEKVDSILQGMQSEKAEEIRQLAQYPENTAGGMMITEFLSYASHLQVRDVLEDLREHGESYSDLEIQYAYVVSDRRKLVGVLRLRDLLMAPRNTPLAEIMVKEPLKVNVHTPLQELRDFFWEHPFLGVPVTDEGGTLLGVVRSSTVREAANRRNNQLFLKFAGIIGGEEFRNMPLFRRSSRRLSWLSINIILNIAAASIIALYQDTLEKAIVLAVFLPIISDMSGCSGNQAVAVSIRELTLGLVRPREILRVLGKESAVGLINGTALGLLLGMVALLWKGNPYLGLVVGASLAANTLVAVSFGGLVPLILRALKTDPALASGPLLTTVTDMCGFFFVLSFASVMLPRLTG